MMALKDWRRWERNRLFNYTERKDGGYAGHITIHNQKSRAVKEFRGGKEILFKEGYLVSAFSNGKETRRSFKTKAQARKFARSYMRRN